MQLRLSNEIDAQKYRQDGEDFDSKCTRIAEALKDSDEHFHNFRETLRDLRFLPAGRVQNAMGAARQTTAYNCFVSGDIEDSMTSIMDRATEAAETMRRGGGIGYDFSQLRPRGDRIVGLGSKSSGPVSFMGIYDAVCQTIASSGHRRGAQMGVLRIDHPDIERFITAKSNADKLTGFNVSVGVTDEFMRCLEHGRPFDLKFNGEVYDTVGGFIMSVLERIPTAGDALQLEEGVIEVQRMEGRRVDRVRFTPVAVPVASAAEGGERR